MRDTESTLLVTTVLNEDTPWIYVENKITERKKREKESGDTFAARPLVKFCPRESCPREM